MSEVRNSWDEIAKRIKENFPIMPQGMPNWVMWKNNKEPYQCNGFRASVKNPDTWTTLETALNTLKTGRFEGVGFVFNKSDELFGIDLDSAFTSTGDIEPWAQSILDKFQNAYIERSPSGKGFHIWGTGIPIATGQKKWKKEGAEKQQGVEIYRNKRYFTVTGDGLNRNQISNWDTELLWFYDVFFARDEPKIARSVSIQHDLDLIKSALFTIPSDDYDIWIRIGLILKRAGLDFSLWEDWSKESVKYSQDLCEYKWNGFDATNIGLGSLFFIAKKHGFRFPTRQYALDDIGNAQRFADYCRDLLRWCSATKTWYVFDSRRWKPDQLEKVLRYAKDTQMEMLEEALSSTDESYRKSLTNHAGRTAALTKLNAMIDASKPELAMTLQEFDSDEYLLNVKNGTLDLRTGILHPHNAATLITKIINVDFRPTAQSSRFDKFLSEIFEAKENLLKFVQRVFGYSLTGSTAEQKIFFAYGSGQNGKSTLFNAVRDLLGDYAQEADSSLLIAKRNIGGPSEDVFNLKGIRLATTVELNEGVRFDEARFKQLSGGDRLTARKLYGHNTEFDPTHKLFIITNNLPQFTSQDYATWRRISLIPFNVQIEDSDKDIYLGARLRSEQEGILAWLVQGALDWQREGLNEPIEVRMATKSYRSDLNTVGKFIEDCCRLDPTAKVQASHLYSAYMQWCRRNMELETSSPAFAKQLDGMGFTKRKKSSANFWSGLDLQDEIQYPAHNGSSGRIEAI